MANIQFTDNALTTLASSISDTATQLSVAVGTGSNFPAVSGGEGYFIISMSDASGHHEFIKCEYRSGDVLGSVTYPLVRGYGGSSARSWGAGDAVDITWNTAAMSVKDTENRALFQVAGAFGQKYSTTTGLTFGYYGGVLNIDGTITTIADGTVSLSASQTNYVERTYAGVVSANTTGFTTGRIPLYVVVTGTAKITSVTDKRYPVQPDLLLKSDLVEMIHIDYDTGHRDLCAARYDPAFFNQQWGGAPHYFEMVDGATGVPYRFEMATGYIDTATTNFTIGDVSGTTWRAQGFKVPQTGTYSAIWIKVGKVGNPTNNLSLFVLPDDGTGTKPTGSTPVTNGTLTAQSGKLHAALVNGAQVWVRMPFTTPCSLTAGTQYHLAAKSSGAVDASNYWSIDGHSTGKYPHGNASYADGTPTWTAQSAHDMCFMIEAPSSLASLQTGGLFSDGKLTFFEGSSSQVNQSNGRVKDLKGFRGLDLTDFTLLIRGTAWTKDKTIIDIGYGLNHDRIVLRSNVTTGYAQIDVYESDGTKQTVTGTTDISTGDHDIMIRVRAKNDGSDEIYLYVDGASQGTPVTSASIAFDTLFGLAQIGTFWLGGGFALAPTYSGSSIGINGFSGLPSTLGWTWSGTGTEANCMSVSGGKLYQNKNGYASTDTGYYAKTTAGLSNANGWVNTVKVRIASGTNTAGQNNPYIQVADGSYALYSQPSEYFAAMGQNGGAFTGPYCQRDFKGADVVLTQMAKSTDAFVFANHRLLFDGSAKLSSATATNQLYVGDNSSTAGENSDAVYSYFNYYTTAWLPPQFTGGSLSELAIWTGDKTSLASPLYNSGTFVSVKKFCGVRRNYLEEIPMELVTYGITGSQNTGSTTGVLETDMEQFVIGSHIDAIGQTPAQNNSGGAFYMGVVVDGGYFSGTGVGKGASLHQDSSTNFGTVHAHRTEAFPFGLHKVEKRIATNTSTITTSNIAWIRTLKTKARASA